jgi:hypothetical protein
MKTKNSLCANCSFLWFFKRIWDRSKINISFPLILEGDFLFNHVACSHLLYCGCVDLIPNHNFIRLSHFYDFSKSYSVIPGLSLFFVVVNSRHYLTDLPRALKIKLRVDTCNIAVELRTFWQNGNFYISIIVFYLPFLRFLVCYSMEEMDQIGLGLQ